MLLGAHTPTHTPTCNGVGVVAGLGGMEGLLRGAVLRGPGVGEQRRAIRRHSAWGVEGWGWYQQQQQLWQAVLPKLCWL
jgi:hypothetical protein